MSKIKMVIKNNYKNVILLVIGVVLLALGNAFFNASLFGSDSVFTLSQGIGHTLKIEVGWANIICNALALIIGLICNRKSIGLGTIIMVCFLGLLINLFIKWSFIPMATNIYVKILYIVLGNLIGALGIALYIYAERGLSPFEVIIVAIQKKIKWPFWSIKIINDSLFYLIGFLLGAVLNVGSIITAIIYGPLIDLFVKLLNKSKILKKECPIDKKGLDDEKCEE